MSRLGADQRTTRLLAAVGAAFFVLTTAACASTLPSSSHAAVQTSPSPGGNGASPAPGAADDGVVGPVPAAPSESAQQKALALADRCLGIYSQNDGTPQEWLDRLTPCLSTTGLDAYQGTDPQEVPDAVPTGSGVILPGATSWALGIRIPTDSGDYLVALTRAARGDSWLIDRLSPAEATP